MNCVARAECKQLPQCQHSPARPGHADVDSVHAADDPATVDPMRHGTGLRRAPDPLRGGRQHRRSRRTRNGLSRTTRSTGLPALHQAKNIIIIVQEHFSHSLQ